MHLTNHFGFKCSHLNFSSEKLSVYFRNKNGGRTISKSIDRICCVSALPMRGFDFLGGCFIALQWSNPRIHTISERLQISKKIRALMVHICQLWFAALVTSLRGQLLAYCRPLVIITHCCFLQKEDWSWDPREWLAPTSPHFSNLYP